MSTYFAHRYFQPQRAAPPVQQGGGLALPVANPGSRGQNMRYYLGNLTRLADGTLTDGVYRYDSNGLSLDRRDHPVAGLPPADESERWDVWRPPGPAAPPRSPGASLQPSSQPSFFGAPAAPPMSLLSPFRSEIAAGLPRPGPAPGLLSRLPPEEAAQLGGAETIAYQGAPQLAELLRIALGRISSRRFPA